MKAKDELKEPAPVERTLTESRADQPRVEPGLPRGAAFGRYLVLERLGEGGMGVVYSAYDPELDRKVAVKIMRPEAVQSQLRLRREAQSMARLQHPNVIGVYDVGMVDGRAFVAMELVEGTTLANWLGDGGRSWHEIVGVFVHAGRGLAAAHATGLVHRDFKPANVLVGRDGRVRVGDFGLARSIESDSPGDDGEASAWVGSDASHTITRPGAMIGTPTYMSPEQLSGAPISVQSDQFSFCVALYRALYRERPFAGEDIASITVEMKSGRGPTPPNDSRVPAWVRDVVLRGLAIDPAQRWPSMDALLLALEHDPVRVRRRWILAGSALAALGLLGFGVHELRQRQSLVCHGAERQLVGVWDAQHRAAVQAAFTATGKSYAEAAFANVARTLDRFAADWVAMNTEACEATRVRRSQSEELLDLRMECLGQRLQDAKAQVELFTSADATVVSKAPQMAASLSNAQCADVAALRAPVRPPVDPAVRARVEALRARIAQAKAMSRATRTKDGLAVAAPIAVEARTLHYRPIEAEALIALGSLQVQAGDTKAAQQTLEEGIVAARAGRDAREEVYGAAAMENLAANNGHFDEGQLWEKRGLASVEALGGSDPEPLAVLIQRAADIYSMHGDLAEALERDQRLLAIREKNDGPDSVLTALAQVQLGRELGGLSRYDESAAMVRRGLATFEKQLGPFHANVGWALINLAMPVDKTGHAEESGALLQRAIDIYAKAFGPDHPQLAIPVANLGANLIERHRYDEGVAQLRRARDIAVRTMGPEHQSVGLATSNLGSALLAQSKFDEAREQFERALVIFRKQLVPGHFLIASAMTSIALADVEQHHAARAVPVLEQTLTMATQGQFDIGHRRFVLARALWDSGGDRVRARKLAEQARADLTAFGGYAKDDLAEIVAWLGSHG